LKNNIKIGNLLILLTVIGLVFAIAIVIKTTNEAEIKFIELKGNYHLSQDEYMKFAHIENQEDYYLLSPKLIKDRLEKHPYIKRVDIIFSKNTLIVELFEKNFEALLITNGNEFLISDETILIPKLPNSEKIDFPIINEPSNPEKISEFSFATENLDVKIGLKIIATLKIINVKLFESLSEVNLRNGKDIILQFSNLSVPIVIGRNNEIKKIVLFEQLMKKLDYSKIENTLSYIDLRYLSYLYLGELRSTKGEQESNS